MFEGWGAAVVGAAVVGAVASTAASNKASKAQSASAQAGIDSENYRFEQATQILKPYVDAGTGSLTAQQDLLGLNGDAAQQAATDKIQNSSTFNALTKQGEDAILQNASATGGVRGGNTAAALGQFRPQLLNQMINEQYSKLGGITQLGQAAAAGQAANGMQVGANDAQLQLQIGNAQAGNALAQGQAVSNVANSFATMAMLKNFGGNTGINQPKAVF